MIDLENIIHDLLDEGYDEELAPAKLCQDIIIKAIATSRFRRNVTIKGGVVMRGLTKNIRRATRDLDMDFIKYSISDESIDIFMKEINCLEGISIQSSGKIEELKHQDYKGKRVYVEITDTKGFTVTGKLDIGVHNDLDVQQEEYCFEVAIDANGVTMIINSKEQIFAEKLYTLLKRSVFSTRYKDVFDMHYLSYYVDKNKLLFCLDKYIYSNPTRENNVDEIIAKLKTIFGNKRYLARLQSSNKNWEGIELPKVIEELLEFFDGIRIETALDKADKLAEETSVRYTHEEVFDKIRRKVN